MSEQTSCNCTVPWETEMHKNGVCHLVSSGLRSQSSVKFIEEVIDGVVASANSISEKEVTSWMICSRITDGCQQQ